MKQLILAVCAALALTPAVPAGAAAHAPATPSILSVATSAPANAGPRTRSATYLGSLLGAVAVEQHRGGHGGTAVRSGTAGRVRGGGGPAGHAGPRGAVPFRHRVFISPFFFSPFAFGAFGLGLAYDPFFWGYPYGLGYPYWGYPYGAYGYGYGSGYGSGSGYGGYPPGRGYERYGSVKFDVKPKNAEVYVDGYYMGQVSDFGGAFHHLDVASGDHKIEIRAPGYQPLSLEMKIMPGRTVNYRGQLQPGSAPRQ